MLKLSSTPTMRYASFPASVSWHESSASALRCRRATRRDLWATRSTAQANKDGQDSVDTLKQAALNQNEQLLWKLCPPPVSPDRYQPYRHFTLRHPDQTPESLRYLLKGAGRTPASRARVIIGRIMRPPDVVLLLFPDPPKHWEPHGRHPCQLVYEPTTLTVVLYEPERGALPETRRYLKDLGHSRAADVIFRTLVEEGHLSPEDVEKIQGPRYQTDYDLDRLKAMHFYQTSAAVRPDTAVIQLCMHFAVGNHQLLRRSKLEDSLFRPARLMFTLDRERERSLIDKRLRVIVHVTQSRHLGVHLMEVVGHPDYLVDRPLHLVSRINHKQVAGPVGPPIDTASHVTLPLFREFVEKVDAHRARTSPEWG